MQIRTSEIKAITFDGDGTLWDFESVMIEALEKVLDAIRPLTDEATASRLSVHDLIEIRDDLAAEQMAGALDHVSLRRDSFRVLLDRIGVTASGLVDHLSDLYFEHRFGTIKLYDDAMPALTKLRRDFAIVLVSNGNNDPARFGLDHCFDLTVFAQDCGFSKPDPRIFGAAMRRLGIEPYQAIHIGDSLSTDVAGAHASGLKALWLNRGDDPNDTPIRPEATIADLSEIVDMINK